MKNRISLRDFYLYTYKDNVSYQNYTLFKLLYEEDGFMFKSLYHNLVNVQTIYPKLFTYLSNSSSYAIPGVPGTFAKNYTVLDYMLINMYGDRRCNGLIDNFRFYYKPLDESDIPTKYPVFADEFSSMLISRFAERWEKYLDELTIDYNPIHNYDMTEDEKVNTKIVVDDSNKHDVQGFNSTDYQPESRNVIKTTTSGSDEDNKRNLTRSGNIGVTTSQQMLESEIKLRDENIFVRRLLDDVASLITVGVYD